jgi:hypothetical protein
MSEGAISTWQSQRHRFRVGRAALSKRPTRTWCSARRSALLNQAALPKCCAWIVFASHPGRTRFRSIDLPARENGWHGGPPATRSTSRTPHALR